MLRLADPPVHAHQAAVPKPRQPSFDVDGNRLTLLPDGPERLEQLLALIAGATHSLRMLYYIYVDDEAGAAVREALIDAARRGVTVSLIVDGLGSEGAAQHHFFEPLSQAGVSMCRFVPRWGRRYLLRNHQKLALADGETDACRVIIGGFNMEDSYFGTAADAAWRDLGLLIEGPAAAHLAGYYDALARWTRRPRAPIRALTRALRQWSQPEGKTRWLFGGPTQHMSPWLKAIKQDLETGKEVDLISAYFAPSPAMLTRLDRAGRRGSVRVVVPSKADHVIAVLAARFTYAGLLRKKVRIFEYQPTKLHTKLYRIDDTVLLGSANFDIRSLYLNLELMFRVEDPAFAAHVRAYIDGEVAQSEAITPELDRARTGPVQRFRQMIAYFIMAVLDYRVTKRLSFEPPKR